MQEISLCMIVKNEEDVLARCLESVKSLVDEIIIVDTGSTDATMEVARTFTEQVYTFEWVYDFAAARNFAFSKATKPFMMWLDADDVMLPHDQQAFLQLKEGLTEQIDVVMMRYNTAFDRAGNPTFYYYRERILKNCPAAKWAGAVHEAITPFGTTIHSEVAVSHKKTRPSDPGRNLDIYERQLKEGNALVPRDQFYYGRELYYHGRFDDAIQIFETFLASDGWLENKLEACRFLAWCYNSIEQQEQALKTLFASFVYDVPRAELCCDIGNHFLAGEQYPQAIYWFEAALKCNRNDRSGGFIYADSYGYVPCLQLCIIYDRMGEYEKAAAYNERAGEIKPDDPAVQSNRLYFATKLERDV